MSHSSTETLLLRLREEANSNRDVPDLLNDAADTIEQLQAEIERLEERAESIWLEMKNAD